MSVSLPQAFEERMKLILGNEYEAFAHSLNEERVQGLRFNTLKAGLAEEVDSCASKFDLKKVPWCREGYIYDKESRPGQHPYHDAGVYYIQEPSAMAAVELMDIKEGEKILDLCAAPGGKSTQIAAKLNGAGLLVSNEIHPGRAKILSQNIERMGIRNAVVIQENPGDLRGHFKNFFDKILVDVPCSGEGMFRKDEEAAAQWSVENIARCAARGQEILDSAADMLKPGGTLLYSTCTFETEEDEGAVESFLKRHSEFIPEPDIYLPGSSQFMRTYLPETGLSGAIYRLWPHKLEGEGHFMALLKKSDEVDTGYPLRSKKKNSAMTLKDKELTALVDRELNSIFCGNVFMETPSERLAMKGDDLYVIPDGCPPLKGLHVLRPGLCLGSVRKNRFEPSHALALTAKAKDARWVVSLEAEGDSISRYLCGDMLPTDLTGKRWVLVCADEYPLGWGRSVDRTLKNHYPKGLRRSMVSRGFLM